MSSPTVRPSAATSSWPPVSVRSGVGIRTVVDIVRFSLSSRGRMAAGVPGFSEIDDGRRMPAKIAIASLGDRQETEVVGAPVVGRDPTEQTWVAESRGYRHFGGDTAHDAAHGADDASGRAV